MRVFLILACLLVCKAYGSDPGNFGLPVSQQPGPLISFGENIIEKGKVQGFLGADAYIGENQHFIDVMPGILYGITDACSVFFNVPIAASYRENGNHSYGLEDLFVQLEYALYSRTSSTSSDQVTLVANASFPTGSSHKNPATGFGAMGYFLGTTYNRTWTKWFCFTSYGVELPTSHHQTRFGNQYLYQFGVGRNIATREGWLLAWMIEIDGTFAERNQIDGATDRNSGGNVIYVTPSFWASSKDWILQIGLGYAAQQHLFGNQKREGFLLALNLGRTF